ncbi:MAG: hydrolase, partial [Pseudomonadota bacterium]
MENQERQKVVEIAKTYLGTPYHHTGMLKGVGVDCLTLLVCAFKEAGLVGRIDIPYYPMDFMQHRGDETYLNG